MKKINIQVLGSGCPSCEKLYNKVLKISKEINPNLKVEYTTDVTKIIELGVMSSPVFAINNQIITAGELPDEDKIKNTILEKINS